MLARGLDRTGKTQDFADLGPVQRLDRDQLHLALGDRAGLVEDDGVNPARLLENLGPFDDDP